MSYILYFQVWYFDVFPSKEQPVLFSEIQEVNDLGVNDNSEWIP